MKRKEIELLLPEIFRRTLRPGNPLPALLEVMEALHAPSETILDRFDATMDPRRTSGAFVPFLAGWVDLDWLLDKYADREQSSSQRHPPMSVDLGRLRELIAASAYLFRWRGTAKGLISFLEIMTGLGGFEIDERVIGADGEPWPFHLRLSAPETAIMHRHLIERVVEHEKPAYVTWELEFRNSNKGGQ